MSPTRKHLTSTCSRVRPHANINQTSDSAREDEIAAKIASLRKQKRLRSQTQGTPRGKSEKNSTQSTTDMPITFHDLPDWKKEDILQNQIIEAEAFLNPSILPDNARESDQNDDNYKPRVSTWGVFPRPENISKAFGGGKKIRVGGVDLSSEESRKRDEAVKEKLAAYRKARGVDIEREEEHRAEIEDALAKADTYIKRSRPFQAIKVLETVVKYVSERSRLGGSVFLSLALAHDSVGNRKEAKDLYRRLRRNPFPEIAGKAKQLLRGFEAMDQLKVDDETSRKGLRVTDFQLPDVGAGIERRYETVLSGGSSKSESIDTSTSLLLLALLAGPVAFVLLVLGPASR